MTHRQNKNRINILRTILNKYEEDIQLEFENNSFNNLNETYVELAGIGDDVDAATAETILFLNNLRLKKRVSELQNIHHAIEKINYGNYGVCLDCGQAIRFKRLIAYPTAKCCIECQVKREKTCM